MVQGRPWLRSVDSEQMSCVIEPRKQSVARADVVRFTEGNIDDAAMDMAPPTSTGSESGARLHRTPQEPGRSRCLLGDKPSMGAAQRSPAGEAHPPTPQSKWMHLRYRRAKETKRGGTGVEKSEGAVVPMKAGNRTAGTRRREGLTVARNCCEER